MRVDIRPSHACGKVMAPPSKSMAHRYLMCAALAEGESVVHGISQSQDMLATMDCLRLLGADIKLVGDTAYIRGTKLQTLPEKPLECRECGTTLRFMLPLCLMGQGEITLTGSEKLLSRPLDAYEDLCREKGFTFSKSATSVTVAGRLTAGRYTLPGNVSSQYISGLLYALSCATGESEIFLSTEVESRSYIDLTLSALRAFGVEVMWRDEQTLLISGGKTFTAREVTVEGDWSNAAFWLALQTLGEQIEVTGLLENSLQGDRVCAQYFEALRQGCPTLSLGNCPDLAPILMVVAALYHGAVFTDTARLQLKESDRGMAMKLELEKCGGCVTVEENRILVSSVPLHTPDTDIDGHNDHRIVMAMAVLLSRLGGSILGCHAVEKSYPDFFSELEKLGIEIAYGTES